MTTKGKKYSVVKSLLVTVLVLLAFSLNVIPLFAQETEQEVNNELSVNIESANFDAESGEVEVNTLIENKTDIFIGNIGYSIELYKGEALAEEGYLFDPLVYQVTGSGELGNMSPGENINTSLMMTPPENLESGNYFIRLIVGDKAQSNIAIDYTEEPFQITGQGGYIGSVSSYFRTSYGDDFAMAGKLVEPEETPSVIIRLDENENLQQLLESSEVYADVEVYNVNGRDKDTPVYTYDTQKISTIVDDTEEIVKIDLVPWEGISANPYTVKTLLKDAEGNSVATPITSRWLVNGFDARIVNVETGTNVYQRGDNLDLAVNVASVLFSNNQIGEVVATFVDDKSNEYVFKKEFTFQDNFVLDFSDQQVKDDFEPVSLSVTLSSPNFGDELDYSEMKISQDDTFKREVDNGNPGDNLEMILMIALLIMILLVLAIIVRKKGSKKFFAVTGLIIVILIALIVVFSNSKDTEAGATEATTLSFVSASFPNGGLGSCSKSTKIQYYVRARCAACLNGVNGKAYIIDHNRNRRLASLTLSDPGHNDSARDGLGVHIWGPIAYRPTLTASDNSLTYRADVSVRAGVWCKAASLSRKYKISCTPPATPPTPPTPPPPPPPLPPISATCGVAEYGSGPTDSVEVQRYDGVTRNNDEIVKWQISSLVTGGNGTYNFAWSGTGGPGGDEDWRDWVYRTRYTTGGQKTGGVRITSGDKTLDLSCGTAFVDICDNVGGVQRTVPAGLEANGYQCDPVPDDSCANDSTMQQSDIPTGWIVDEDGNCLPGGNSDDWCANDPTMRRADIPAGWEIDEDGNCLSGGGGGDEWCANDSTMQQSDIPTGWIVDEDGNCLPGGNPDDWCANDPTMRRADIPAGWIVDGGGNCLPDGGQDGAAEIDFEVKPIIADEDGLCPATWTVSNVTECRIVGIYEGTSISVDINPGENEDSVAERDEYRMECTGTDGIVEWSENSYICNESDLIET